ncbi:hypothetical protein Droror1_Dr00001272 [Drosera rotundifolia]
MIQVYLFYDYWEDIGTIKSFFDANLSLTEEPPKSEFYDPKTPFFTSARFLPPTKVDKCRIVDSIILNGCFLRGCSIQHSMVGIRSRLETGVELQVDFTHKSARVKSLNVHRQAHVRSVKFIPNKSWIVTGVDDMFIRVYDSNSLEKIKQFEVHEDYIRTLKCYHCKIVLL